MVGNSYTFYSELQDILANMLREGLKLQGEDVVSNRQTSPGKTWEWHLGRGTPEKNLAAKDPEYDYVILQEQSLTPGYWDTYSNYDQSLEAAIGINDVIAEYNATTILFQTWGRRGYHSAMYPDYLTNQDRITEGFKRYQAATTTEERPVLVAPVGEAFRKIFLEVKSRELDPSIKADNILDNVFYHLYTGDGSHPHRYGSMLAAYVMYIVITGLNPQTTLDVTSTPYQFPDGLVEVLQAAAWETMQEWNNHPSNLVPAPQATSNPTSADAVTPQPTTAPTPEPTAAPTSKPTVVPTQNPTPKPTAAPTSEPTSTPTVVPTQNPTAAPTPKPTAAPTPKPTTLAEAPTVPVEKTTIHGTADGNLKVLLVGGAHLRRSKVGKYLKHMLSKSLSDIDITVVTGDNGGERILYFERQLKNCRTSFCELFQQEWDVVVLQDAHYIPGLSKMTEHQYHNLYLRTIKAARSLTNRIKAKGARPIFLQNWALPYGDPRSQDIYPDYETMQDLIVDGYFMYQEQTSIDDGKTEVSPVGLAFDAIYDDYVEGDLDPLSEDTIFRGLFRRTKGNLSSAGAYLTALVLYATITNQNPDKVEYMPNGMSIATREQLQNGADAAALNTYYSDTLNTTGVDDLLATRSIDDVIEMDRMQSGLH